VAGRRAFVKFAVARQMSASGACALMKVSRRRLAYVSRRNDEPLVIKLKDLAASQTPRDRDWPAVQGRASLSHLGLGLHGGSDRSRAKTADFDGGR